jgi:hypothetical protein
MLTLDIHIACLPRALPNFVRNATGCRLCLLRCKSTRRNPSRRARYLLVDVSKQQLVRLMLRATRMQRMGGVGGVSILLLFFQVP